MAPKRTSGPAADVLRKLMKSQQDALNKAFDDATLYSHPGLKGGKREEGVSTFLAGQLPQSLKVVTGQAIDYRGSVSSQLDIMVYDANLNAPLHGEGQAKLLPAEALLAIVEVKTVVTLQEWDKVSRSVAKYLELMPYKNSFGTRRSGQKAVSDNLPRCFYSIVAFSSDLVKSPDWPQRELARMRNAFGNENCLGLDRVLILDRGVINPAGSRSLSNDDLGNNLFAWYVS